jgi:predicted nucleic acid-binding protein
MSLPDAQIAAMALEEGAIVAIRNTRDFIPAGVELVDPWTA